MQHVGRQAGDAVRLTQRKVSLPPASRPRCNQPLLPSLDGGEEPRRDRVLVVLIIKAEAGVLEICPMEGLAPDAGAQVHFGVARNLPRLQPLAQTGCRVQRGQQHALRLLLSCCCTCTKYHSTTNINDCALLAAAARSLQCAPAAFHAPAIAGAAATRSHPRSPAQNGPRQRRP